MTGRLQRNKVLPLDKLTVPQPGHVAKHRLGA